MWRSCWTHDIPSAHVSSRECLFCHPVIRQSCPNLRNRRSLVAHRRIALRTVALRLRRPGAVTVAQPDKQVVCAMPPFTCSPAVQKQFDKETSKHPPQWTLMQSYRHHEGQPRPHAHTFYHAPSCALVQSYRQHEGQPRMPCTVLYCTVLLGCSLC